MELAIRMDNILFAERQKEPEQKWQGKAAKEAPRTPKNCSTTTSTGNIPEEEMTWRRKEGACFKCRKQGHRVNNCRYGNYMYFLDEKREKGKEATIEEVKEDKASTISESEN